MTKLRKLIAVPVLAVAASLVSTPSAQAVIKGTYFGTFNTGAICNNVATILNGPRNGSSIVWYCDGGDLYAVRLGAGGDMFEMLEEFAA
jgi:hypothetical protein